MVASVFSVRIGDSSVNINTADSAALLDAVCDRLRRRTGFAIATLNLDHLVKLRQSTSFRRAYQRHDFVVADGNPVVWLSRLAGRPVSLVPGSDLVEPLVGLAAQEHVTVALLGATEETLARAAAALALRHPGLEIVARLAPGRGFDADGAEASELIEALRRSGAGLTLLALGAPRQELFAARCRAALPDMGFASIGAGLDFLADSQQRAPLWMRRIALEWLWRLMSDPRRMGARYAGCALALPGLALAVIGDRIGAAPVQDAAGTKTA